MTLKLSSGRLQKGITRMKDCIVNGLNANGLEFGIESKIRGCT